MNHRLFWRIWTTGIVLLFLAATILTATHETMFKTAAGNTVYVDSNNTTGPWNGSSANPYQNITSGLAHASNGDIILVRNGTYKENVAINKSIELKGESKPIINGQGAIGISITANNVTVNGFTVTNSSYGVYCTNASGFTVANNTFSNDGNGLYWNISENNLATDYTTFDSTVKDNEFNMNTDNNAIYISIGLTYTDTNAHDVNIGSITISNNTLNMQGTQAHGIHIKGISIENLYSGKISIATLNASANKLYGGSHGIDFTGTISGTEGQVLQYVQASVGDLIINDNVMLNQSGLFASALSVDGYRTVCWSGNTTGTFGDFVIEGNTINSPQSINAINIDEYAYCYNFSDHARRQVGNLFIEENKIDVGSEGIHVKYGEAQDLQDHASVILQNTYLRNNTIHSSNTGIYLDLEDLRNLINSASYAMENIVVEGNTVNSSSDGVQVFCNYVGFEMSDNSAVVLGNLTINDNTINSARYGVYYVLYDFGHHLNNSASIVIGNLQTNHNKINSSLDGIYVNMLYFGYVMEGNSSFTVRNIEFNDNSINGSSGITLHQVQDFGSNLFGNASFVMNNFEVNGNIINSTEKGVYAYLVYKIGYLMHDNSTATRGDFTVNNNVINGGEDGINVYYLKVWGDQIFDKAIFTRGSIEFDGNSIINNGSGFVLANLENATIKNNTMQNCSLGMNVLNSYGNRIYHNNFNSTVNAQDHGANMWDNGYNGGNWWSDYAGSDNFGGVNQNEVGSDGISDSSYVVNGSNFDNYPLMAPFHTFDAGTWDGNTYFVDIVTHSALSNFAFDTDNKTITFNVEGLTGASGLCRVSIPTALLTCNDTGEWTVKVDGTLTNHNVFQEGEYTYIYFEYLHSMHAVEIKGTKAVPEFTTHLALSILLLAALALAVFNRRKLFLTTPT
jgi:parallel beta-helix repeat protein